MYVHVRPRVLVIARGLVAERARTQARGEAALIKILRLMWLTPLLSQVPVIGTGLTQLLHFLVYSAGAGRGRRGRGVSDLTHPEATDWRALDPTDAFGPYYRIIAPNNFVCSLCVCKTQNKFARRFKI